MRTTAVRLYGKNDVRLETFDLPPIKEDEILAKIVTDSLCMSSYKAVFMAEDHNRVPNDIAKNPIILGHECCGIIEEVGKRWKDKYYPGQHFTIQPAINYKGGIDAPGYSFPYCGGDATYMIIPSCVMEMDCLLPYNGDGFFYGSLAEPVSCVIGSFMEFYHSKAGVHTHEMGILSGGNMLILAGAGPMGFCAVDYIIHAEKHPGKLVVTDIDQDRLDRMSSLISSEEAAGSAVDIIYMNTGAMEDPVAELMALTDGHGYDDVLVMAPVKSVCEQADELLAFNGCLSFFSGPKDTQFSALVNYYNIHYRSTHFLGTVGGNTEDMRIALRMCESRQINPAGAVTHIGGLNCAAETTINLPSIPGGKKLIYNQIDLPLTALDDFPEKGKTEPLFAELAALVEKNGGLWNAEAEAYLLENAEQLNAEQYVI